MRFVITEEQLENISDRVGKLLTGLFKGKDYIYKITSEPIADDDYEDEAMEIYAVFDMDKLRNVSDTTKNILRVRTQVKIREYVETFFPYIEFGVYTRPKNKSDE
jgi:hypothetical protein